MPQDDVAEIRGIEARYLNKYGDLMTLQELAQVFKYPSAEAVKKAVSRGTLRLALFKIDERRAWFASTLSVVEFLKVHCADRDAIKASQKPISTRARI